MHVDVSDLYPHAVFGLLGLQVVYLGSCHVLPPEPTANVTTMVTQSPNKQKSEVMKQTAAAGWPTIQWLWRMV